MDKKYGVYICTGCGIGDALDIEALSGVAGEEGLPVLTHPFLCSQAGVDIIKKDTEEKSINTMVIGACSRRVNFDTFRFVGSIVERVNLREGVVWSHPRDQFPALTAEEKEDEANFDRVQMMAEDYIRMGMIRVEKIDLPEPYVVENLSKKIMVLGGGPNRIGQGIEFDYCCVHAAFAMREDGYETIMVNCNPETVSTDYDTSDRLYFEPLTLEDVLEEVVGDIFDESDLPHEDVWQRPDGTIRAFGTAELHRVCRRLGIDMPSDAEVATVGGLISEGLGRIPERGDELDWRGFRFTVLSASGRGVDLVSIAEID